MAARKINKKSLKRKTLASSNEAVNPNNDNANSLLVDTTSFAKTAEEENFWHSIKGKLWMFIFAASIIFALIAGVFMYKEGTSQKTANPLLPTPSIEPQTLPSPTPEEINISKYKIVTMNGSGIQGDAARAKTLLEQGGFTVISIGNADRSDYRNTVIQAKKDIPQVFISKLKSVLGKMYTLAELEKLLETEESDVMVIVGKSRNESKQ